MDEIHQSNEVLVPTFDQPSHSAEMACFRRKETVGNVMRGFLAFGKRFKIFKDPSRLWYENSMRNVMLKCCRTHDMTIDAQKNCLCLLGTDGIRYFSGDIDVAAQGPIDWVHRKQNEAQQAYVILAMTKPSEHRALVHALVQQGDTYFRFK